MTRSILLYCPYAGQGDRDEEITKDSGKITKKCISQNHKCLLDSFDDRKSDFYPPTIREKEKNLRQTEWTHGACQKAGKGKYNAGMAKWENITLDLYQRQKVDSDSSWLLQEVYQKSRQKCKLQLQILRVERQQTILFSCAADEVGGSQTYLHPDLMDSVSH